MKSLYFPLLLCLICSASGLIYNQNIEDDTEVNKEDDTRILRVFDAQDSNHLKQKHLVRLYRHIFYNGEQIEEGFCSGSIISDSWIITAAHCFKSNDYSDDMIYDIYVVVERIENKKWVELGEAHTGNIITHPKFVYDTKIEMSQDDIALVKTDSRLPLNRYLVPIKLHKVPLKLGYSTKATIAGYGDSEVDTSKPRQGVVIVSHCNKFLGYNLLCSYKLVRAGSGDSGGPLVSRDGTLLGVTSASCDNEHISKPCKSVYVEVSHYLEWITSVTGIE